jgi:hypothetical protein
MHRQRRTCSGFVLGGLCAVAVEADVAGRSQRPMNKIEAKDVLRQELDSYRALKFDALVELVGDKHYWVTAPSGSRYHLELNVVWEGRDRTCIRVRGLVDDGGMRALLPLNDSFLVSQDDL